MDKVADVVGVLSFSNESFKLKEMFSQLFKQTPTNKAHHDVNVRHTLKSFIRKLDEKKMVLQFDFHGSSQPDNGAILMLHYRTVNVLYIKDLSRVIVYLRQ